MLLGEYLGTAPEALRFGYAANGKPYLKNPTSGVSFNVAHCDSLALIAIAEKQEEIGVDVEKVRWMPDFDALVSRFFSRREAEVFVTLEAETKPAAFFNLWTRKEALLKATGEGICGALNGVEVSFLPGEPARLLALPDGAASDWTLRDFVPADGYVAALAVKRQGFRLRFVPEGHLRIAQRFNVGNGASEANKSRRDG